MSLRVLMMGTGTFALPTFERLISSAHDVVGLVTQPDRVGRGHHQHVNEMKECALANDVDVFQPDNVNTSESLDQLRHFTADIFVVAAYGQILSKELLEIPRLGAVNLHGSLLPKYRGAAPVQYAVLNDETETGVTLFQIEPRLDAGPILGVVKTEIGAKETSGQLHDRLADLSAQLTIEILDKLEAGTAEPLPQPVEAASKAPKIHKSQGLIDWTRSSREIHCHIYGMQPWPMPFTFLHHSDGKSSRVLILDIVIVDNDSSANVGELAAGVALQQDQRLFVGTGSGAIEVLQIQPAGKRPMQAADFLRGTDVSGAFFDSEQAQAQTRK